MEPDIAEGIMNVLIACEYSGIVRDAFIAKGHNAMSCDLLPTETPGPHYQGSVIDIIDHDWDMMIAHPPCTHIAVSGAAWFIEKIADGRQQEGIDFFKFLDSTKIYHVCIENPVCIMSTVWRKPSQIIHPYQFGHPERKTTCLWLKNLPVLTPSDNVEAEMLKLPIQEQQRLHYLPPSKDRGKIRSQTYQGVANAMADQWSTPVRYQMELF